MATCTRVQSGVQSSVYYLPSLLHLLLSLFLPLLFLLLSVLPQEICCIHGRLFFLPPCAFFFFFFLFFILPVPEAESHRSSIRLVVHQIVFYLIYSCHTCGLHELSSVCLSAHQQHCAHARLDTTRSRSCASNTAFIKTTCQHQLEQSATILAQVVAVVAALTLTEVHRVALQVWIVGRVRLSYERCAPSWPSKIVCCSRHNRRS